MFRRAIVEAGAVLLGARSARRPARGSIAALIALVIEWIVLQCNISHRKQTRSFPPARCRYGQIRLPAQHKAYAVRADRPAAARRRRAGRLSGGVYQALAEADLHPDWVAGISIGAINSALIAGNPPEERVERLREFWETVSKSPFGMPYFKAIEIADEVTRQFVNQVRAMNILLFGAPNFFVPRMPPPRCCGRRGQPTTVELLRHLAAAGDARAAGRLRPHQCRRDALQRRRGQRAHRQLRLLRHRRPHRIGPSTCHGERLAAARAFRRPRSTASTIWDGGLVSNTPLQWVLDSRPRQDTLAFQVDLWSARGELPRDLAEVEVRQKEIHYSSRTRAATDQFKKTQKLRDRARQRSSSSCRTSCATSEDVQAAGAAKPTTRSTTSSS